MTGRCAAFLAASLGALSAPAFIASPAAGSETAPQPGSVRPVEWAALASPDPASPQRLSASKLSGQTISLSGYLLPADREGELVYSFMLVARRGACSHMQQPPPSQVIRVVPSTPYRLSSNYEPVTITGALEPGLEKTQLFILDGAAVITSGYTVRGARVSPNRTLPARTLPGERTASPDNPWHRVVNGTKSSSQPPLVPPESLSRTR